jgi:hypothetical protein
MDPLIWNKLMHYVVTKLKFNQIENDAIYKIYHINDLVYEFASNRPRQEYICYNEMISDLDTHKIKNAITYQRIRTIYQCEFQPLNKYYNITDIVRNVFVCAQTTILFEKRNNIHEIMILYQGTVQQFQMDKNKKYVLDFLDQVNELF